MYGVRLCGCLSSDCNLKQKEAMIPKLDCEESFQSEDEETHPPVVAAPWPVLRGPEPSPHTSLAMARDLYKRPAREPLSRSPG